MSPFTNRSGFKVLGRVELPDIKEENARLESEGSSTRVLTNGYYVIDHARKWQVGAVIFFDDHTNHFGKLAVRAKSYSTINFRDKVKLSKVRLDREDLVLFCVEKGNVAEVIPTRQVSNLPWDLILTHVGYYKEISFQYNPTRTATATVPVISTLLREMKEGDIQNMLEALYRRLQSIEDDKERSEYLEEVMEYGVREVFTNNCLSHEYAESLIAKDSPYLGQYYEVLTAVLRKYIAGKDYVPAARIYATFKGLDDTYEAFIEALNEEDREWRVMTAIIRAFPKEKEGEDFFLDIIRSDCPVKPKPQIVLIVSLMRKTEPYNAMLRDEVLPTYSDEAINNLFRLLERNREPESIWYILGNLPEDRALRIVTEGAPESEYARMYAEKKWIKDSALNYVCIDLESDGSEISQAVAIDAGNKVVESRFPTDLPGVLEAIGASEVIIGHNINSWDLPILKRKGLSLKKSQIIWDTYEWEMILDPTRFSYALQTEHDAVADARLCKTLFWNQLYRIIQGGEAFAHVKSLLPKTLSSFIQRLSAKEYIPFLKEAAGEGKTFFREATPLTPALKKKLSALTGRVLILAPQELWPLIASEMEVSFPTATDPQFFCLKAEAVAADTSLAPTEKAMLETFVKSSRCPMPVNLSRAARRILTDKALAPFRTEVDSTDLPICTDMFGVESLGDLGALGIKAIHSTGYEFESRNNRVAVGEPFCAADLLKSVYGAKLLMQLSGATVVPILEDECRKLGLPEIPSDAKNIWMHKDEKGLFQVYCNKSFDELLGKLSEQYPKIPQHLIEWIYSDTKEAHITIAATFQNPKFDARMKRVTPASRYRSMYWVYQFALIDGLAASGVKVLYVSNPLEVDPVRNYALSLGYFVPERGASVQRQVELCAGNPSPKKIVVVGPSEFKILRESKIEYPICLLWDNLDIESLQVMWRGLLPFGDEPEYEAERKEDEEGIPSTLSCILGVWPMVKYYYHQLRSQNPESSVCLLDPSFDDYRELEKSFLIGRQEIGLWDSEEAYREARTAAQSFFAGKKHEDDMPGSDFETAKEMIRQIFLDPKVEGGRAEWSPIQEKALPQVYARESHSLVCIPTGGGKSVLFQGPALYRSAFTNRLSIVITPLKALMQDQVSGLQALGFLTNVEYLNSDKSRPETSRIYRKITGGEIALLYVTPERFRSRGFRNALELRMEADEGLEYIIFDEAHCISQWGLDFRPEYLSTAIACAQMVERFPDTRIELFSATVTGQVRDSIEEIIRPLTGVGTDEPYNPVRNHIGMEFRVTVDTVEGRAETLYGEIAKSAFDPEKSRMLVFSRTRKMAEEVCELLKEKLKDSPRFEPYADKVGYFHAGMDAEDRTEAFDKFHDGEYVILVATKAFGMGMDIPNIHYVFHLSPPQFLEDYLQEVGRAGRNKKQYEDAGFSPDRPIPTQCFVSADDFRNLRSLLAQGMLSWEDVRSIYNTVKEFVEKFQPEGGEQRVPIAVPDNIWKKETSRGAEVDPTSFRLGLYWLERMQRVNMGYYASTTLDIALPDDRGKAVIKDKKLKEVYQYILAESSKYSGAANVQVYINDICSALSIGQNTLFRYIIQGTKQGLFSIVNKTAFSLTKLRTDEVRYCHEYYKPFYVIEAVFEATRLLLSGITVRKEAEKIDLQKRNAILDEAIATCGVIEATDSSQDSSHMPWYAPGGTGISTKKTYMKDLSFKRAKHLFAIIDMLPGTSVKSVIDRGDRQVVQEVYLSSGAWERALSDLKRDTLKMVRYLAERFFRNERDFVWTEAINELQLQDNYQYLCDLISVLRMLGFINADSILSTGIEIMLDGSQQEIEETPSSGLDKEIYESFTEVNSLKEIKFALMDTFSDVPKDKYDEYIQYYFSCKEREDYMKVLSLYNGEDNDRMKALQKVAIKTQEDRLDAEQRAIYEESIDNDINVIAGPGSGKTHVLTLRCAKLVYHHHVLPQNILVLAYNRAVVEELKSRLSRLFTELGYGRSMSQLQIYTFHGLAKKYCYQRIQDLPLEKWEQAFLDYITSPSTRGAFRAAMGNVQYILIDEFQDITQVRLNLILQIRKLLTRGSTKPRLFTIGDINQSIYGYERAAQNLPMDPIYYYNELRKAIRPKEMHMTTNYRSYQGILDAAFKFIPTDDPTLLPHSSDKLIPPEGDYVFMKDRVSWFDEFPQIIQYFQGLNEKESDERRRVKTVAVFFRRNDEVYRGYSRLRGMNLKDVRIRVQGSSGEFFRTRECYSLIESLRREANTVIPLDMKQQVLSFIENVRNRFPAWDSYYLDLTYALAVDFLSTVTPGSMTYADMADYLEDMGEKDDGQLSKVLLKHKGDLPARDEKLEIVLTTMHKVKGLEFEAVVITPSYQPLGYNRDGQLEENWQDLLKEERRLYYVAYTRAKKYLFAYRYPREMHVEAGQRYMPSEQLLSHIGHSFDQGFDKFNISYTARNYAVNDLLLTQIRRNDEVRLSRNSFGDGWNVEFVTSGGIIRTIGVLSKKECDELNKKVDRDVAGIRGLFVSDIYVWRYEDTLRSDRNKGTSFAQSWSQEAIKQGYILIADIAGFTGN
jgi:ATP-dependent DNA helicase RecQ